MSVQMVEGYTYLYEICQAIQEEKPFPIDELNILGGRLSAKSISVQIASALILRGKVSVVLYFFRYMKENAIELFDEIIDALDMMGVSYLAARGRLIIEVGKNKVRVIGFNSRVKANTAQKSGMTRTPTGTKYLIRVFEEVFEIPLQDRLAAAEATRGIGKDLQELEINICNPWSKGNEYVAYCGKYQKWDLNTLKTTGSQFGIYNIEMKSDDKKQKTYTKRTAFHYTNWRIAKEVLPEGRIMKILDTWNTDKRRAMTTDYGLPGYESGAIYTHLLEKIGKAIYQEHEYLSGGFDFGWGTNKNSSKTVAHFLGASLESGIDVYGEYVSDNREKVKDINVLVKEVVSFFLEQMRAYCNRVNYSAPENIRVRCDYMNIGVIALLNEEARKRNFSWLKFVKCNKNMITSDRIEFERMMLGQQLVRFADNVRELRSNMEFSYFEDTETQKRIKQNDDALNSFEYAVERFSMQMIKRHSNLELRGIRRWHR